MTLDLVQVKDGEKYPWAEHVNATLCNEHHEIVQTDPEGYFPERVTTTSQE